MTVATAPMTYREAMREAIREAMQQRRPRLPHGRGRRPLRRQLRCEPWACSTSSGRSASATRRCRSRRSWVPASGPPSAGLRPIVEIMTVNFSLLALDQIVNNAATLRHMSGGQVTVPVVIRMTTGARPPARRPALAQPGGLVRAHPRHQGAGPRRPSTTPGACSRPALADPTPSLIFEHGSLYNAEGDVTGEAAVARLSSGRPSAGPAPTSRSSPTEAPCRSASPPPTSWPRRQSTPRSSTSASLRPLDDDDDPGQRRWPPTAPWSSTRGGAPAAWPPRSARGSWRVPSTTSTPRCDGCAAPRCRSPTPSTSKDAALPHGGRHRRRRRGGARRWVSSACPRSAPTWRRAPCSSGASSPATRCAAATSSPSSTPTRPTSTWRSSRPASSTSCWCRSANGCRSAHRSRWCARTATAARREASAGRRTAAEPPTPAAARSTSSRLHSPVLRRLAHHLGVDLAHVSGHGTVRPRSPATTSSGPPAAPTNLRLHLAAVQARAAAAPRSRWAASR